MCGSNPFDISSFNDSSSREQPSDANPSWTATPTPSYSATSQHTSAELVVVPDDSCGTLPVPPSPNHSQGKRRITFVPQSSVQALVHRHQSNMATATELKDETSWYTIGLKLSGKGSAYTRYTSQPSPRLNIPASDQGGDYYLLQQGIMRSWEKAEPTEAQKKSIRQLRDTLTDLLNQRTLLDNPTGKRYIVDVFGSVAWGGSTGSSGDVDLVIIVSSHNGVELTPRTLTSLSGVSLHDHPGHSLQTTPHYGRNRLLIGYSTADALQGRMIKFPTFTTCTGSR